MKTPNSMWPLFVSEFTGTALLLLIGLSFVILNWGEGSITAQWLPNPAIRRAVTGFLFGSTGCLISLSKVGKISGAHINPAVSFAFWLRGKMKTVAMLGYIISQLLGAVVGCIPLLWWHQQGSSIHYANTVPGAGGIWPAFWGEVVTTAALITLIFSFAGIKKLRNYTPYTMPFLYSFMVWTESPLSGCSTNPARSFGPAVISGVYTANWIYWLAPLTGAFIMVVIFKGAELHKYYHLKAARVSYHDHPTHECLITG